MNTLNSFKHMSFITIYMTSQTSLTSLGSGIGRGGAEGLEPPPFVLYQLQLSLNHRDLSMYSALYCMHSY